MDAQKLDLGDASVDGAVFRFGPMLLPDPAAHAREVRRVVRPDGRYACAVFAGPERNGWMTIQMMSFVQSGFQPPGGPADPGSPFSLSDPDTLRSLWQNAGFDDVTIETLDVPFQLANFDELWRLPTELAGPIAVAVGRLSDDEREKFRGTLENNAENFRSGEGYVLPGAALCVLAR
jgi:SAM-dependent methyltransferase